MARLWVSFLLSLVLACVAAAQTNPTMTSQRNDSEKENLYAAFTDNKRVPTADRQRLAYEAATKYLRLYGAGDDFYIPEMRKFVADYEKRFRLRDLLKAYNTKNYKEVFETGRAILKLNEDDFYVLSMLTQAGYESAQAGNAEFSSDAVVYARKANQLLQSGKVRNPEPFQNEQNAMGYLNLALGSLLKDKSPVEAAAAFVKVAQSDSAYAKDPLIYNLLGITILKGEYAAVSADYNARFGNKPPSDEQQTALKKVMHLGDRAIDAYARAVAFSTRPEQQEAKAKMLAQLTALYKNFHNNSDEGLTELIATVLGRPVPAQ
jgi:hypothetical protein